MRRPQIERLEINQFLVSWEPSSDDFTPADQIRYEIGIIRGVYCVVTDEPIVLTGDTAVEIELPNEPGTNPVVGFTIRPVDEFGRSPGYSACGWISRSAQRVPLRLVERTPSIPLRAEHGPDLDCRPDTAMGAWCRSGSEVAHFGQGPGKWDIFMLPSDYDTAHWLPLDNYDVLLESNGLQIELQLTGQRTFVLGSQNTMFDADGGAISSGYQTSYLLSNGYVSEFRGGNIDFAGPPRALRLPDECTSVAQLGTLDRLSFAVCVREAGTPLAFVGIPRGANMEWQDPFEIRDGYVSAVAGTDVSGLMVVSDDRGASLYQWDGSQVSEMSFDELPGSGQPFAAASGNGVEPFVWIARADDVWVYDGVQLRQLPSESGRVTWHGVSFPALSHFVSTREGVLAISQWGVVRLRPNDAELVIQHSEPIATFQGQDRRIYHFRTPFFQLVSTHDGGDWYNHGWDGPAFTPRDVTVAPNGRIYLSGTGLAEDGNEVPSVLAFSEPDDNLLATLDRPVSEVPQIEVDRRGRLYALFDRHLAAYVPAENAWSAALPVPFSVDHFVGLESGALVVGHDTDGQTKLLLCADDCFQIEVPGVARGPISSAVATQNGFCLGVQSRGIWCRRGQQDEWLPVSFSAETAAEYGLAATDSWDIVYPSERSEEGSWLLAIRNSDGGLLAELNPGDDTARLLGTGFDWADGVPILDPQSELGVMAFERAGPLRIKTNGEEISIYGQLY
ncbi:MAG: hypothetical protein KC561_00150 [Myxococcales bacterium]|nr:hypothetical protein [Myxococcales bacterium]